MTIQYLLVVRQNDLLRPILSEDAYAVREAVFLKERGLDTERDRDTEDELAIHIVGYSRELAGYNLGQAGSTVLLPTRMPVAAARVTPHEGFKLSRVCVLAALRQQGIGREMLKITIKELQRINPHVPIHLNALNDPKQVPDTVQFYEKLGFESEGKRFLEAGFWHQRMVYSVSQKPLDFDPENDVLVRSMRAVGASEEIVQSAISTTTPENFVPDPH